tara:strand:- start:337 stop:1608 length:1272 start_codon:yes stop_codon:yes gene_type:complete
MKVILTSVVLLIALNGCNDSASRDAEIATLETQIVAIGETLQQQEERDAKELEQLREKLKRQEAIIAKHNGAEVDRKRDEARKRDAKERELKIRAALNTGDFQKALELDPSNSEALKVQSEVEKAEIIKRALDAGDFEKVLKIDPAHSAALRMQAASQSLLPIRGDYFTYYQLIATYLNNFQLPRDLASLTTTQLVKALTQIDIDANRQLSKQLENKSLITWHKIHDVRENNVRSLDSYDFEIDGLVAFGNLKRLLYSAPNARVHLSEYTASRLLVTFDEIVRLFPEGLNARHGKGLHHPYEIFTHTVSTQGPNGTFSYNPKLAKIAPSVRRGDYLRIKAEFWIDVLHDDYQGQFWSETPSGKDINYPEPHFLYHEPISDVKSMGFVLKVNYLLETATLIRAADLAKDIRRYFPNEKFHVIDE